MPLKNVGTVALVHKPFNASNQGAQFNFGEFLKDATIARFVNGLNTGDLPQKIGFLYNGLFDLHQTKRKVPVGSYAKTTTDFGVKGEQLEIILIRRSANEASGDDDDVVGPTTITLKRISAVIAHTVLTYMNGRMRARDYTLYKTITGEDGSPRVINALFDKYYQLPPYSPEDELNLMEIARVYLGYVPGFDFLCTAFPAIVGTICCIRQNYPDVLGLYSKSENLLDADKMQRIYQSIGTKLYEHNGRHISYLEYMTTPGKNNTAPIEYSHTLYSLYFEGRIARRVSNNLSNISRFNQAILNLKGNRGLENNATTSEPNNNASDNNNGGGNGGASSSTGGSSPSTRPKTPGVNQQIPQTRQRTPSEINTKTPHTSYAQTLSAFAPDNPDL